jgi:hypothetical protein
VFGDRTRCDTMFGDLDWILFSVILHGVILSGHGATLKINQNHYSRRHSLAAFSHV